MGRDERAGRAWAESGERGENRERMGESREIGKSGERVRRDTIHDKPPNQLINKPPELTQTKAGPVPSPGRAVLVKTKSLTHISQVADKDPVRTLLMVDSEHFTWQ